MKTRHTPKTASCLYMLGFASGLLFIVLCGSSTIYEEFAASLPNRSAKSMDPEVLVGIPAEIPAANIAKDNVPAPLSQVVGDLQIDYARSDAGGELSVLGLGFEPGERVVVSVMSGETTIASAETQASGVGGFSLDILLPQEARSLTEINVVAVSATNTVSESYALPGNVDLGTGGESSGQPAATLVRPTCTCIVTPLPPPRQRRRRSHRSHRLHSPQHQLQPLSHEKCTTQTGAGSTSTTRSGKGNRHRCATIRSSLSIGVKTHRFQARLDRTGFRFAGPAISGCRKATTTSCCQRTIRPKS